MALVCVLPLCPQPCVMARCAWFAVSLSQTHTPAARYEAAAGEERQSRDWMGAGRYYRQAQQIFPSGRTPQSWWLASILA